MPLATLMYLPVDDTESEAYLSYLIWNDTELKAYYWAGG